MTESPPARERVTLTESGTLTPSTGRIYRAVAIRPGEWKGHRLYCPPEVLQRSVDKFNGLSSFMNPPAPQPGQHGYPGVELLAGFFTNARWDDAESAIVGDYHVLPTAPAAFTSLADRIIEMRDAAQPVPDVGLSAVPWIIAGPEGPDGTREVTDIISVEQLDVVYRPAAGGELQRILAAEPIPPFGKPDNVILTSSRSEANGRPSPVSVGASQLSQAEGSGLELRKPIDVGDSHMPEPPQAPAAEPAQAAAELLEAQRSAVLDLKLSASGLPAEMQDLVRQSLKPVWRIAELEATIDGAKGAWARLAERSTIQGVNPQVTGMTTGLDQMTEALSALIDGRRPNNAVPLSGIREAYIMLSGDYEMAGRFRPDRVSLANVNSTTMANIVADLLNKRVVASFQKYPQWWRPMVRQENFTTLQTVQWIILGGLGALPTVAEGGAYAELVWDDNNESSAWVKKGGYLGITLEAMDKDDVGRLRTAPQALAQAAYLAVGKDIAGIFTQATGTGPLVADGTRLFTVGHGNLGTTALSASAWNAAKIAMRKQTEVNSGERLGGLVVPRYLLVPPDLEQTALIVLASEGYPSTANNDANPEADGNTHDARMAAARRRIVVVDFWTDLNDWAAVADPALYPTIGLGYRFGETPEIFSVAAENSGLMFTNDVMPIKVRYFYAVGPMDYRGLYKSNVA